MLQSQKDLQGKTADPGVLDRSIDRSIDRWMQDHVYRPVTEVILSLVVDRHHKVLKPASQLHPLKKKWVLH